VRIALTDLCPGSALARTRNHTPILPAVNVPKWPIPLWEVAFATLSRYNAAELMHVCQRFRCPHQNGLSPRL